MHFFKKNLICVLFIFIIFWLPCHAQTNNTKSDLSFDFGITRGRNINIWPLFKKYKDSEKKELQIIYPFFSKTENLRTKTQHTHLFPVFINNKSPFLKDLRIASLYYPSLIHIQKNDGYKSFKFLELAPYISCLGLSQTAQGVTLENNLLFFLWYKRDTITSKTRLVCFPLYWYKSDSLSSSHLLFPLFYYKQSNSLHEYDVSLLFHHSRTDYQVSTTLFPIWWNKKEFQYNDTFYHKTLFPLFWSQKSKDYNLKVLLPIYFYTKRGDDKKLTIFPFIYYGSDANRNQHYFTIFPFWWYNNKITYYNDTIKKRVFFPVYWNTRSGTNKTNVIFPIVFYKNNEKYRTLTVFPLFSKGVSSNSEQNHLVITPLFWHFKKPGKTETNILPLWYYTKISNSNDTLTTKVFFPLFWNIKDKYSSSLKVLPFFYKTVNQQSETVTIFPFYSSRKSLNKTSIYQYFIPFYYHTKRPNEEQRYFVPFLWFTKKTNTTDTLKKTVIFPFYWSSNSNETCNRILFPLWWNFKTQNYRSTTLFPLVSYGKSSDSTKKHFTLFPVYLNITTNNGFKRVIFPLWWNFTNYSANDTTKRHALVPFYWRTKSKTINNRTIAPIYAKLDNPNRHFVSFLPLYIHWHSKLSDSAYTFIAPSFLKIKETFFKLKTIFPIYWNYDMYYPEDTLHSIIVIPFYWLDRDKNKESISILPFYYFNKTQRKKSTTIFPFITKITYNDSSEKQLNIYPFYYKHVTFYSNSNTVFPLWWSKNIYLTTDTIKYRTLFPIYWSKKTNKQCNKTVFPFYFNFKNEAYHSLTVLPFFSYGTSSDSTKKYLDILPFWWSSRKITYHDTVFRKMFFPVYFSYRSKNRNNTFVLPTIYLSKETNRRTTVIFPFYSHKTDNIFNNQTTSVLLLFRHKKNENSNKYTLFPLFKKEYRYLQEDTATITRFYPFYWSKRCKTSTHKLLFPVFFKFNNSHESNCTFFPILSFGKSRKDSLRYVIFTPLAGIINSSVMRQKYVFPLFNHKVSDTERKTSILLFLIRNTQTDDVHKTSILWPLCEMRKGKNLRYFRFAPFLWYTKTDKATLHSIQPIYYSYKSNEQQSFSLFWILYRYNKDANILASHCILWKLFKSVKYTNGDFETRFLHQVYSNINVENHREKSLLPFYHFNEYANGDKTKSYFFGFYNYFKQYKPELDEYYEEDRIFWVLRLRSNYQKLINEGKVKEFKRR